MRPAYAQQDCDSSIQGVILDRETEKPIPFATVKIEGSGQGTVADEEGKFELRNICAQEAHLMVSHVGYKPIVHHHDAYHNDPQIYLAQDDQLLESIVVEDSREEEMKSIAVQKKQLSSLELTTSSVGEVTEEITGVSLLKTGSNITKPIIHGLHSNRVLVINDGVRHGYQVWGAEHAPEIDASHVDQIQIVKGAGTVKYGPEALGGVILYNAKRPEFDRPLNGVVGSSYQTNGRALSSKVSLGHGFHRFAWNVGGFGIRQADLEAPNYNLSNTGKREYGGSFNTLLHLPQIDLQLSGSYIDQQIGILRASIVGNLTDLQNAIDRGEPNPTFDPTYDIQNPQQDTKHGLVSANLSAFLGEHVVKLKYAYQENIRREFDVRRGELNNRPVIDLNLTSHTMDLEWIQPEMGRWSGSSGVQIFTQKSVNEPGSNPANFVPDYDVLNMGAFTVQSLEINEAILELGARFDYQTLNVADTIREQTIYDNELTFRNATFTLGFRKSLGSKLTIFSNIGSAWRPPNVAELYSFGYHFSRIQFGLWRYEFVDRDPPINTPINDVFDETVREVPSEKSYKWVSGLEWKSEKINAELVAYVNQINDYIFLRPFGITTGVAGTFPYFIYDQTNALFIGSDLDIRYHHTTSWTSEAKISYVWAQEREKNQPFIEIPPLNVNYSIDYHKNNFGAGLNLNYHSRQGNAPEVIEPEAFQNRTAEVTQDNIFDFMAAPDAFLLVGAEATYQWKGLTTELKVDNLFNTSYRVYTDRLRYFADATGRNFSLSIGFQF